MLNLKLEFEEGWILNKKKEIIFARLIVENELKLQ